MRKQFFTPGGIEFREETQEEIELYNRLFPNKFENRVKVLEDKQGSGKGGMVKQEGRRCYHY